MPTSGAQSIRILIVDGYAIVRQGLRLLLESKPGWTVVGEAATCAEALVAAADTQPDIIVLDLVLGAENALDCLPELLGTAPTARVLILTGVSDPDLHCQAVRLGAMGLVRKEKSVDILYQAIAKVHAGEVWLERTLMANVLGEMTRTRAAQQLDPETAKIAVLTPRERTVIALIGEGLKNKRIAACLGISEITVRHHLTTIFDKLEVSDRLDLVVYAYRHGLATLPQ